MYFLNQNNPNTKKERVKLIKCPNCHVRGTQCCYSNISHVLTPSHHLVFGPWMGRDRAAVTDSMSQ